MIFSFNIITALQLVNNCLDIDHSCSHLPAVNPAIFQGVTFNNFGSGFESGCGAPFFTLTVALKRN